MKNCNSIQLNNFLSSSSLKQKKRIWELDFLRGLCIVLVILDHMARLTYYYFGKVWYGDELAGDSIGAQICRFFFVAQTSDIRNNIRIVTLFLFFSLCGISSYFSKSNIVRGAKLGIVACCISFTTYILQQFFNIKLVYVSFGAIHFISFCILIYTIMNALFYKYEILKPIIAILLVIGITYTYHYYIAPETTPKWAYFIFPYRSIDGQKALFYYNNHMSPGDLVNLIPWSAFFFIGVALKPLLYPTNESLFPKLDRAWHKPITFIGRHSLLIYLTHALIIGIILLIISKVCFNTLIFF